MSSNHKYPLKDGVLIDSSLPSPADSDPLSGLDSSQTLLHLEYITSGTSPMDVTHRLFDDVSSWKSSLQEYDLVLNVI